MKRKVTCFTSMALAVLMAVSPVVGSSVSVFAAEPSDDTAAIQVTPTEEDSSDDKIVVETNSDAIEAEKEMQASVKVGDAGESDIVVETEYLAGDSIPVHVTAENPTDKAADFRLYFWDYGESLPEDKGEWSEVLTDACEDVKIAELQDADEYAVDLKQGEDNVQSKASFVSDKDDKDHLTAAYLSMEIPAGASLDTVFHISSDAAETVTVVPAFDTESENLFYGDAAAAQWKENPIVVEADQSEDTAETEPETEDIDAIVVETEEPADSFLSIYVGDGAAETPEAETEEPAVEEEAETEETDTEVETESEVSVEAEGEEDAAVTITPDMADLNASDFASMRLVVLADDAEVITNDGDVIGQYEDVYLLQFTSIQQTMNAYAYYKDKVQAVEPDVVVETASKTESEEDVSADVQMDETENPVVALSELETSENVQKEHGVIALIDTGVSESENIIDRVSVIDEVLGGNEHGDDMVEAIVSQDAEAKILSIRALDNNGFGTISSLVAAMEYAIEQKVAVINLSLYAKATLSTSVLEQEILKATNEGILVVGSAGNDGQDVAGYMPGAVEEAYIIGAAKEDGSRLETSNFGETVDYNVVAGSTSEAAALFTGYVSANGLDAVEGVVNQELLYATDYQVVTEEVPDSADGEFAGLDLTGYSLSEEDTDGVQNLTVKVIGEGSVGYTDYTNELVTVTDELTKIVPELTYVRLSFDKPAYVFVVDDKTKILEPYSEQKAESFRDISITVGIDKTVLVFFDKAEALKSLNEQFQIAADLPSNVTVGTQYTGECKVKSVNQSHTGGTVHGVTFGSFTGVLAGKSISGNCADHTAAAPFVGQACRYTLTVKSISGNTVTAYLYVTPKVGATDGVTSNDQGLIGYQRMDATVTLTRTPPITYKDISVKKSWSDYKNESGARPSSVQIGLYRSTSPNVSTSGSAYKKATLNASNGWSAKWTNLVHKDGNTTYYYAVKEMSVPQYYTVSYSQPGSGTSATVTNKIQEAYLKLHKDSALPNVSDNNNCYSLAGAEYTVYTTRSGNSLSGAVGVLKTNENGDSNSLRLLPKTYYIKETKAPTGFEPNPQIYTVKLTTGNTTSKPYVLYVEDVPGNDPTGIEIDKIYNGPDTDTVKKMPLTGTQFTIKYYDGYYNTENELKGKTPLRTWVLEVKEINGRYMAMLTDSYLVSGELYRDGAGQPCLPLGTITIQETKAAPGYTLDGYLKDKNGNVIATDSELYVAKITEDSGAVALQGGNEFKGENTPTPNIIKLKKFDSDGKTPLAGVTFEIRNSDGDLVEETKTNSKGEIVFDDLYPDVYTIKETATVDGHTLLKDPIVIEVPMMLTDKEVKDYGIDTKDESVVYNEANKTWYIHEFTFEVTNNVTFKMPMSGGFTTPMTFVPLIAGMGIMGVLGVVGFRRKQKK